MHAQPPDGDLEIGQQSQTDYGNHERLEVFIIIVGIFPPGSVLEAGDESPDVKTVEAEEIEQWW